MAEINKLPDGRWLLRAFAESGISFSELARRCRIHRGVLALGILDDRRLGPATLRAIEEAFRPLPEPTAPLPPPPLFDGKTLADAFADARAHVINVALSAGIDYRRLELAVAGKVTLSRSNLESVDRALRRVRRSRAAGLLGIAAMRKKREPATAAAAAAEVERLARAQRQIQAEAEIAKAALDSVVNRGVRLGTIAAAARVAKRTLLAAKHGEHVLTGRRLEQVLDTVRDYGGKVATPQVVADPAPCVAAPLTGGSPGRPIKQPLPPDDSTVKQPLPSAHDTLLTADDAARYLRISRRALYVRVSRGTLVPLHLGRSLRFRLADLDRQLMAGQQTGPARGLMYRGPLK